MGGARYCIWFSLGYRGVEIIFKDESQFVDFIGDITMDIAKVIISIFLEKIIFYLGPRLIAAAGLALIAPVSVGIAVTIVVGLVISFGLSYLDEKYHISDNLKLVLTEGFKERNNIVQWNFKNGNSFINSFR